MSDRQPGKRFDPAARLRGAEAVFVPTPGFTPTGRRGVSNGPTEAVNALIKKVKRVGHGFRNLANYRLRLLLAAGVDWNTVTWQAAPATPISGRSPHLVASSR